MGGRAAAGGGHRLHHLTSDRPHGTLALHTTGLPLCLSERSLKSFLLKRHFFYLPSLKAHISYKIKIDQKLPIDTFNQYFFGDNTETDEHMNVSTYGLYRPRGHLNDNQLKSLKRLEEKGSQLFFGR